MPTTHWGYYDAPTRARGMEQLAICGAWMTRAKFSTEPTCPSCQERLAADAEDAEGIDPAAAQPRPATVFDPTSDYVERRR